MKAKTLDFSRGKTIPKNLKPNSIDEITSNYLLPYLSGPERIVFIDTCWRAIKPGGKLVIKVHHWSSMQSVCDPDFKWPPICEMSFLFFNKEWREKNAPLCKSKSDFDFGYGFAMDGAVAQRNEDYRQYAAKHLNNAVLDILITMTKR